jgi:lipopolysaccharide export system protein LptC
MSVELHLPDLPEVPISLGPAAEPHRPQRRLAWHLRAAEALSAYLPLLLMGLVALATWWLVKNTPVPGPAPRAEPPRSEPDYTMRGFALERFDANGRLKLRIEGELLRHFPDTDRVEIEGARISAFMADGRTTVATARRALGNGDGSELQLFGGAQVHSSDAQGAPLHMASEFLHAYLVTERIVTASPVRVRFGATEVSAGGLEYEHASRKLELRGPIRAVIAPRGASAAAGKG